MKKILMVIVTTMMIITLGSCGVTKAPPEQTPEGDTVKQKSEVRPTDAETRSAQKSEAPTPSKKTQPRKEREPQTINYKLLIKQLGNDDWETRETAQKELTKFGEKLIEHCQKVKVTVKKRELKKIKGRIKKFAQVLSKASQSKDPDLRLRANLIRQHFYSFTQPMIMFESKRGGKRAIYIMSSDGKNQRRVVENPVYIGLPVWSPDGTKIAFCSNQDGNAEIYVMDAGLELITGSGQGGKNLKNLTQSPAGDYSPVWSPNGTKIAFRSNRDGNAEIYVMSVHLSTGEADQSDGDDVIGKNLKRVTNNSAWDWSPIWSPDGTKIVFASNRADGNMEIYVIDLSEDEAGANAKNPKRLTKNTAYDVSPTWSPDGTKMAFQSNRDGNMEIYIMSADGSNPTRLTENPADDIAPVWSPDGTKIAFCSNRDGNKEIYIIDLAPELTTDSGRVGKDLWRLTDNLADDSSPVWCPWVLKEFSTLFSEEKK